MALNDLQDTEGGFEDLEQEEDWADINCSNSRRM
jgi:hypothetical protein